MTLNTFVAGDPGAGGALADFVSRRADVIDDKATGWNQAQAKASAVWEGAASEAFIANRAAPNARDGDALATITHDLAQPFEAFGDGLRAVKDYMEQAKQVARDGELTVQQVAILPPPKFTAQPPAPLEGRVPAAESATHAEATRAFEAAKALQIKREAAYTEAQAIVHQARDLERRTHDEFRDVLEAKTNEIKGLGQFRSWSRAAASATTPAAVGLMKLAADLETKSVKATQAAFEKAASHSPYATNSMWAALTAEQRADFAARHPQTVGSTNGVPVYDRDTANRLLLTAQRDALANRVRDVKASLASKRADLEHQNYADGSRVRDLEDSLDGLDNLITKLGPKGSGYYLLGIDSTAADRGQVIIASGDPDTAQHVSTTVPGTFSDLGDALGYVEKGDNVKAQAGIFSRGESVANVTYVDYESPKDLLQAVDGSYAHEGSADLSQFQEGLRASHSPEFESHNTIIGHSYGTTLIGYAARDHGMSVDDMVLLGSPGTGAATARDLLPNGQVWAATAPWDPVPAASPDFWYGPSPADPVSNFGAHPMPVGSDGDHNSYWSERASRDGMARIVAGTTQGM